MARSFRKSHREDMGVAFPVGTRNYRWAVWVGDYDTARVTVRRFNAWSSGVITVEQSEDGINGQSIGSGITIGPPGSTVQSLTTDALDVQSVSWLILRTSTEEAGVECDAIVHGKAITPTR